MPGEGGRGAEDGAGCGGGSLGVATPVLLYTAINIIVCMSSPSESRASVCFPYESVHLLSLLFLLLLLRLAHLYLITSIPIYSATRTAKQTSFALSMLELVYSLMLRFLFLSLIFHAQHLLLLPLPQLLLLLQSLHMVHLQAQQT